MANRCVLVQQTSLAHAVVLLSCCLQQQEEEEATDGGSSGSRAYYSKQQESPRSETVSTTLEQASSILARCEREQRMLSFCSAAWSGGRQLAPSPSALHTLPAAYQKRSLGVVVCRPSNRHMQLLRCCLMFPQSAWSQDSELCQRRPVWWLWHGRSTGRMAGWPVAAGGAASQVTAAAAARADSACVQTAAPICRQHLPMPLLHHSCHSPDLLPAALVPQLHSSTLPCMQTHRSCCACLHACCCCC